jgi:hypothetical protein
MFIGVIEKGMFVSACLSVCGSHNPAGNKPGGFEVL